MAANAGAWALAIGAAIWWQQRENSDKNKEVFSSLDAARWNAAKKAELAALGKDSATAAAESTQSR